MAAIQRRAVAVAAAVLLALVARPATAYSVVVKPGQSECFFELLEEGAKMGIQFEVGTGGQLDIDFELVDPNRKVLFLGLRQNSETYTFAAETTGRYEYCFKNGMSTVTEKTVSFDVMADNERGTVGPNPSKSAEDVALDAEVGELMHNLRSVRDNQQYMRVRERAHRDTAESTNARIQWYSTFQVGILVVVCIFQLWYLRRFFEVKQVI